jgi:hypothetical protein
MCSQNVYNFMSIFYYFGFPIFKLFVIHNLPKMSQNDDKLKMHLSRKIIIELLNMNKT